MTEQTMTDDAMALLGAGRQTAAAQKPRSAAQRPPRTVERLPAGEAVVAVTGRGDERRRLAAAR